MKRFVLIGIPALIIIGLCFTNAPYQWLTQRTVEAVLIKDKQISTESEKKGGKVASTYLIFTDQGVFRNDDAGWFMKYNSSDVYGNLDIGSYYRMKVYGWRIPILSMYPNIVHVQEVKPKAPAP
ncbi:MAG: DUF1523 family protein [Rickettsiales bacterium]